MRKVIIFIVVIVGFSVSAFSLPVNECKTDIYFGNGVWNSSEQAKESVIALEERIIKREIIKGDPVLKARYGKVKLQYNWGLGEMQDVLETYYQLKKEGQVNDLEFFMLMMILTGGDVPLSTYATGVLMEAMPFVAEVEQANVNEMLTKYYKESFQYSHRVLLVSHSQGNLFANRVYDSIAPAGYKEYFANVQVASPASSVHASKGTYVTGSFDPVINPIPGSMESNADLDGVGGHAFVDVYLDSRDTYTKIVRAMKTELNELEKAPSQWEISRQPSGCERCEDLTVQVKHRFDKSVRLDEEETVLPYNTDPNEYRLYQVGSQYVLASCGGTKVTDLSRNSALNICSRLEGTGEAIPKMTTLIDGVCIGVVDSDIDYQFNPQTLDLLVGTIGDNYWGGECKVYERYITLLIENSEKLKSFKLTEVGFDDWIQLSVNREVFYRSPYSLPPDCELSTSFVEYPNIEIRDKLSEGLNRFDMKVIVTGGGEGWFRAKIR